MARGERQLRQLGTTIRRHVRHALHATKMLPEVRLPDPADLLTMSGEEAYMAYASHVWAMQHGMRDELVRWLRVQAKNASGHTHNHAMELMLAGEQWTTTPLRARPPSTKHLHPSDFLVGHHGNPLGVLTAAVRAGDAAVARKSLADCQRMQSPRLSPEVQDLLAALVGASILADGAILLGDAVTAEQRARVQRVIGAPGLPPIELMQALDDGRGSPFTPFQEAVEHRMHDDVMAALDHDSHTTDEKLALLVRLVEVQQQCWSSFKRDRPEIPNNLQRLGPRARAYRVDEARRLHHARRRMHLLTKAQRAALRIDSQAMHTTIYELSAILEKGRAGTSTTSIHAPRSRGAAQEVNEYQEQLRHAGSPAQAGWADSPYLQDEVSSAEHALRRALRIVSTPALGGLGNPDDTNRDVALTLTSSSNPEYLIQTYLRSADICASTKFLIAKGLDGGERTLVMRTTLALPSGQVVRTDVRADGTRKSGADLREWFRESVMEATGEAVALESDTYHMSHTGQLFDANATQPQRLDLASGSSAEVIKSLLLKEPCAHPQGRWVLSSDRASDTERRFVCDYCQRRDLGRSPAWNFDDEDGIQHATAAMQLAGATDEGLLAIDLQQLRTNFPTPTLEDLVDEHDPLLTHRIHSDDEDMGPSRRPRRIRV